jgi:hypothetical protein
MSDKTSDPVSIGIADRDLSADHASDRQPDEMNLRDGQMIDDAEHVVGQPQRLGSSPN